MGWVEATVKIVTGLAWPTVVGLSVFLLRRELAKLMKRLTRFAGPGGIEAEFKEDLAATSELAEVAAPYKPEELDLQVPRGHTGRLTSNPTLTDLLDEAEQHPVGGVMRAWHLVEDALTPADQTRPLPPYLRLRDMHRGGVINDDLLALARRLQDLRNRVVHGRVIPDPPEAREFVTAAWRLAAALNNVVAKPGSMPTDGDRASDQVG
ncbi:hypothetical protein ACGF3C_32945 [Micromonospora sp. NPDC047762]|uniref:hypothetical protein n=1 Tax=Micromonospora sp. NPDC047762 TaxID=3364255 RepID=UPI00371B999E